MRIRPNGSTAVASLFAGLLAMGCATATPSTEKTASSSASIRAAEEVGASHDPNAALYLQLAKEEFGHAKALTHPDDKERADRLLVRAQADAELSLALARSESEKAEAAGEIEKLKSLKKVSATQ